MSEGCVFCDQSWMREAEIFIEAPHCIFASTWDPGIRAQAELAEGECPAGLVPHTRPQDFRLRFSYDELPSCGRTPLVTPISMRVPREPP